MKLDEETGAGTALDARMTRRPMRRLVALAFTAAAVLGALLAVGYWPRAERAQQLAAAVEADHEYLPSVTVAPAEEAPVEWEIELPGDIQAEIETPIFARADGYIKRRLADIGDRVSTGQLLAEVDSPELEQQIREAEAAVKRAQSVWRQAEAALDQAKANLGLAEITATRWRTLVDKGVLSKQDGDEKQAAYEARKADVAAAEANARAAQESISASEATLQRLRELQSFRQVRAPFIGVITARNVDVGTLVSAGSGSSLREMFRIAQTRTLRVFVNVPQSEALLIRPGLPCMVEVEEHRGRQFPGKVTRTSNAIDITSRTLLTEVGTPNPDGALLPGMYATVRFRLRRQDPMVLIPSAAFRHSDKGPMVAVLGEGGTVHFAPLRLGRNHGAKIEVLEGLQPGQMVITSLTDEVREGVKVRPVTPTTAAGTKTGGLSK